MIRPDMSCAEAIRRLALAEPGAEGHMGSCSSCRAEAAHLEQVVRALRDDSGIAIPSELDQTVRALLARRLPARGGTPIPGALIFSIAATVVLFLVAGISLVTLHPTGQALVRAGVLVAAYLVVTSTATLPLLLHRIRHRARTRSWT